MPKIYEVDEYNDSYDDGEVDDGTTSDVYSLKLVNGEHIMTELIIEEGNVDSFTIINPIIVQVSVNQDGVDITYAREFDLFTDEAEIQVPWANVISSPTIVKSFFKDFYVKVLIHTAIKNIKLEIIHKNLPEAELEEAIKVNSIKIENYIYGLEEKFGVSIEREDYNFKKLDDAPNKTLH